MGKRSDSLGENRDRVGDQIGKAEVVNSEDENGMEVGIEASDIGRQDGYGLGDRDEFSRLCLVVFRHIGGSIIVVVLLIVQTLGSRSLMWTRPNWAHYRDCHDPQSNVPLGFDHQTNQSSRYGRGTYQ